MTVAPGVLGNVPLSAAAAAASSSLSSSSLTRSLLLLAEVSASNAAPVPQIVTFEAGHTSHAATPHHAANA